MKQADVLDLALFEHGRFKPQVGSITLLWGKMLCPTLPYGRLDCPRGEGNMFHFKIHIGLTLMHVGFTGFTLVLNCCVHCEVKLILRRFSCECVVAPKCVSCWCQAGLIFMSHLCHISVMFWN